MPSPFPGMNPYLENPDVWPDFHNSLLTYLREQLNEKVGDQYFVAIEEQVYVHELPTDQWRPVGRVDVAVSPIGVSHGATDAAPSATASAPSTAILVDSIDTLNLPFLEIRDRRNHDVVTVIEVLSPSNKRAGPDREQYSRKRMRLVRGPSSFVEIDLLRGGRRHSFQTTATDFDYYVLAARPTEWPRAQLWPIHLRDRLPEIAIPLRPAETGVSIDLQALLNRAYDSAGYAKVIYSRLPDPPLSAADNEWAKQFIPAKTGTNA